MLSKKQRATIISDALAIEAETNKWLREDPKFLVPIHSQKYDVKETLFHNQDKIFQWKTAYPKEYKRMLREANKQLKLLAL